MSTLVLEEDFSKRVQETSNGILSLCYQCGACTASCPLGVPVRRLLRAAQLGAKSLALDNQIWNCATCKFCELGCPRGVEITSLIHVLRVLGFEDRKAPSKLEQAMWSVYENGNPWGGKKGERGKWAEGLGLKSAKPAKYLLYVGCAASFDPRLQQVARSVAKVLLKAEVDFGVLGDKESCCGDTVYQSGEEGFLEELAQNNIESFRKSGAETIITISPHCLNMFKAIYPKYGEMLPTTHYTEFLASLLDQGKLQLKGNSSITATYHDPCYLGRYHGIYEEPRKVLENVPGVTLTEMADSKENALCCGGGGGLMWLDHSGERPSHSRVTQAADVGAGLIATSCPYCIQNFEDGVKTKAIKGLRVLDVAEVVERAMDGDHI